MCLRVPGRLCWAGAGQGPGSAPDKTQTLWPSPPGGLPLPPPLAPTCLTSQPPPLLPLRVCSLPVPARPCSPQLPVQERGRSGRPRGSLPAPRPPPRLGTRSRSRSELHGLLATGTDSLLMKTTSHWSPPQRLSQAGDSVPKDQDSQAAGADSL